ncbi:MAG: aminopeptidase [Eubacterium sp.]|nr:aminopeptidase [Eubacterium sp.]
MTFSVLTEDEMERFDLAFDRLKEIAKEQEVSEPFGTYFRREAAFLVRMAELKQERKAGRYREASKEVLEALNRELYGELVGEKYETCYGNPAYAVKLFGRDLGRLLSFLYTELRGAIQYAYEDRSWDLLVVMELLLQIYGIFSNAEADAENSSEKPADRTGIAVNVRGAIYWYCMDYLPRFMADRTRETLDPDNTFLRDLVMKENLDDGNDLRFLYRSGEYVSKNEQRMAQFLAGLPQKEIDEIALTFTKGFKAGFDAQKKDLTKKKTVNVRYRLGFERIIRSVVIQFREMGLESVIYRSAPHSVNRMNGMRIGFYGAVPNPQFDYDHKSDAAIYMDENYVTAKLQALREAYEAVAKLAYTHAGPACFESFGEVPFEPAAKAEAFVLSKEQRMLQARYAGGAGQITNRFIKGEERSFTIIAYPVPEIGEQFEDIFRETIKVNNLSNEIYRPIQQKMIDALDQGEYVHVTGINGNCTDLTIHLHHLDDPGKQTNFENCVADVNIPVGEVFTSPVLEGTTGTLFVSEVFLEGLNYRNLKIVLTDGMVTDYSCSNFESEEENRRYIEENILFHHPTVPIGEFAIGTNTTAYAMARKFRIADKMPILIAEKTGPHFAFGDTCYSYEEDLKVYNPDGREIIARENEVSAKRKTEPSKAYFNCHTDVTIPYEELGEIKVLNLDGSETVLLSEGRFVLPGTEVLNRALDE